MADLRGARGALAPPTAWDTMEPPQEFFAPSMEEGGAQDFRSSRKKLQPPYTLFLDPPLTTEELTSLFLSMSWCLEESTLELVPKKLRVKQLQAIQTKLEPYRES